MAASTGAFPVKTNSAAGGTAVGGRVVAGATAAAANPLAMIIVVIAARITAGIHKLQRRGVHMSLL